MRILGLISVVAPHYGGPSTGAVALFEAMRAAGEDYRLITGAYADPSGRSLSRDERAAISKGAEGIRWLEPARPFRFERTKSSVRSIFRAVKDADVVHVHGQYMWTHVVAAAALRRYKRPYGLQPHGSLEPYQRAQSRLKKSLYELLCGGSLLRRASYVLFASESEAKRASSVPPEKAIVIPLGASLSPPKVPTELSLLLGDAPRAHCMAYLGRLAHKKRPDLLIQAWARARKPADARLILAGPDGEWSAAALRELADNHGVHESVILPGAVVGGEKTWLLGRCGSFVLPSENENFGISVAEAMLAGQVVIVTDQVAASEHVQRAHGGAILQVGDEQQLAAAIERVFGEDPAVLALTGERNRAYASRELTWDAAAARLASHMKTLLNQ